MSLPNGKIERIAVDSITVIANKPNSYLSPNIPVGDKGISFDGEISVFIDDSEKKESLVGIVPVQVKGTQVEQFRKGVRTFSLEIAHFKNFYKRDGALLFVVEVNADGETKIFYKSLLPTELSQIIKHFGHQQTRSVELRPLEETKLYTVCRKFLNEQKYQPRILVEKKPISEDTFQEYSFTSLTFNPEHEATKSIFDHDFTVYGVLNETKFPLHFGRISSLETNGFKRFFTNGEHFDLLVNVTVEENKTTFVIENIFAFAFDEKSKEFNMRFLGFHSLAAQSKTIPFVIHLLSGHPVEFEGGIIGLNEDAHKLNAELQEIIEHNKTLSDLEEVFHTLGIKEDTIFREKGETELYRVFDFLIQAILHNQIKGIRLENPDQGSLINFEVGDRLAVLFYNPSGEKKLSSAFSEDMLKFQSLIQAAEPYPHSIYTMLIVDSLVHGVNFDPQTICESFDQFNPFLNEDAFNRTNEFCLKCVSAFDQSGDYRLLELADHIYNKFRGSPEGTEGLDRIVLINRYQIQKRKEGHLIGEENDRLFQLKKEAIVGENTELLFCANVLLENRVEAKMAFGQLEQGLQGYYQTLPIYALYQKLISMKL